MRVAQGPGGLGVVKDHLIIILSDGLARFSQLNLQLAPYPRGVEQIWRWSSCLAMVIPGKILKDYSPATAEKPSKTTFEDELDPRSLGVP